MRALKLDYQRAYRPIPWLGLGVLAAALVSLAAAAGYHQELQRQIGFWEARADHFARLAGARGASRPLTTEAARAQLLEVKHANQVVRQLDLPWSALFKAVESSGDRSVALLSLEPDLQRGTVKISGEAKDFDALLKYVRELSTREVFGSVMLQQHQVQQDVAEKPVRFSLLAHWKGVGP